MIITFVLFLAATESIPFCTLLPDLAKHHGEVVSVRGVIILTDEFFAVGHDGQCERPFVTANRNWPACIVLDVPADSDVSVKEAQKRIWRTQRRGLPTYWTSVSAAVTGKLVVVQDNIVLPPRPANPKPGDVRREPVGFGHLGVCPAVIKVEKITELQSAKPMKVK
jgi:hypothetical protein